LPTVARETAKYKLDLLGIQEVRWDRGVTEPAAEYTFFCRKGNETHELRTEFFVHKRIISAVKNREPVSDRMPHATLIGRQYNIVVLNAMP
jgi:hypothetical protein